MQDCKVEACASGVLLGVAATFGSVLSAVLLGALLLALWYWNHLSTGPAAHQVRLLCLICWSVCSMGCMRVIRKKAPTSCKSELARHVRK